MERKIIGRRAFALVSFDFAQDRLFGKLRTSFQNFYYVTFKLQLTDNCNNQNLGEPIISGS